MGYFGDDTVPTIEWIDEIQANVRKKNLEINCFPYIYYYKFN